MKITSTSKKGLEKFNLAVLGPSKTGKTHLIKTIKGKPLLCNADKGTLTLKGVDIKCVNIDKYSEFVDFMKYITTSDHFVKQGFDWVIFDSVSAIADMLKIHLEEKGVTGFDFWGEYLNLMKSLMITTRNTNRFNSLSIYEVAEKENSSGLLEKKFGIEGSLRDKVPYFYDFVFATKKLEKKDKPKEFLLQSINKDGYAFLGGRDPENKINDYEPANIPHIVKKLGI